jgi:methionyl-tRNA synthetase
LKAGNIYKGRHEGWYSVTDECFYKDSQVEKVESPGNEDIRIATETGSKVEWTSEENYMFRLSAFQEQLRSHYKTSPEWIVPHNYYLDVLKYLEKPLDDISISRPRSRLEWGIPVPNDPEQTIYVWFDALVNYLTVTGYPETDSQPTAPTSTNTFRSRRANRNLPGPKGIDILPADVHVIGKDIVR